MKRITKNLFIPAILIILFLAGTSLTSDAEPKKLALIIAVAHYPEDGGWSTISSDNDVPIIYETLIKQGFDEGNIRVIMDERAKKADIVDAIKRLTEKAEMGDVIVIHYSGHGQQIFDDNGDEMDGYDESLIPFDAGLYFSEGYYEGERHLRDEEFGALLTELRKKVGKEGCVLVTLDSCHSGNATRGLQTSRGTELKFAPEGYDPEEKEGNDKGFMEMTSSRGDDDNLGSLILISGSSHDEVNYEYRDPESGINYGSLSYAFSKHMSKAEPTTTYRGLFDNILVEMSNIAPRQTPQLEGDIDTEILGGKAVEQTPYYKLKTWVDENTIIMNAGNLMGIFDNTIVEFYPVNTTDPLKSEPLATGTVVNSSVVESDVILDNPLSEDDAKSSWIFVAKQNYGDMRVKVQVDITKNKSFKKKLLTQLEDVQTIELVELNPDLLIEMNKNTRGTDLNIITTDELSIYKSEIKSNNLDFEVTKVVEKVKNYAQAGLLRNIEMSDPYLDLRFEIVPITVKKVGARYVEDQRFTWESKVKDGKLVFNEGDAFKLIVGNLGYDPAYFQILDIQPDNTIGLLIPSANRPASEYKLYPGDIIELDDIFQFKEPPGTEIFKLIASREVLNLQGIVSTRSRDKDAEEYKSPFEQLFADSYKQTRAQTLSVYPASANIFTVPIIVEEFQPK